MAKKKEIKRRMIEYAIHLDQAEARIDELEQQVPPSIYSHPEYMALASKYQEILGRVGQTVINLRQLMSNSTYLAGPGDIYYAEALRQIEEILPRDVPE